MWTKITMTTETEAIKMKEMKTNQLQIVRGNCFEQREGTCQAVRNDANTLISRAKSEQP